jgi:hypothetical protein
MVIHVTLTKEILFEFSYYTGWKAPWNREKRIMYYLKAIFYTLIMVILIRFALHINFAWEPAIVVGSFLVVYFAIIVPIWIKAKYDKVAQKFFQSPQNANIFLPTTIEVNERGIKNKDSISEANYLWSAFVKKAIHKKNIYLYLNNQQAVLIPESSLENKIQQASWRDFLRNISPFRLSSLTISNKGLPASWGTLSFHIEK